MNHIRKRTQRLAHSSLLLIAVGGCNIGTGGTGEYVVPKQKLRNIDGLDLTAVSRPRTPATEPATRTSVAETIPSATAPSTGPSTQPTTRPTTPPTITYLSLADARRLAMENNLDLKVELLNPTISKQSLTEEEARYEANFTSSLNYAKTDNAVASQLVGSQSETWQFNAGLEIPLRTGGSIRVDTPLSRSETDNQFTFLNPAYTAGPAATITMPLLRGFGVDYNAQRIRVAFYAYQSTQARTKLEVIRVLTDVERVYWRLYAAREELKLRQREYELAVKQYDAAARKFKQETVPEVDLLRAESGAADKFENIIVAEKNLRDRQRELKRLLNAPGLELESTAEIIPATRPMAIAFNLDSEQLSRSAMGQRMELLEEELRIAEETANVRNARSDMLPLVTLEYTYGINGLGPELNDALSQVRSANFQDHRAAIRMEVPIGNEAARSRLRRSLYSRLQRLASKEQRQLQIRQEVFTAVDALEAAWQRILSSRKRVLLAARVLDGEQRQYDLGRRTSTEVLDAQTRLANARQDEIAAVAEYQIAQVDIAFATGMVLGQSQIAWQPTISRDFDPSQRN
ncbi:TolC family protein [Humisphaera borealis]|uniref:TolC family protein n=1 Tax=Humisphaera borealis TaxID=2807512 RepID=A0A7M2X2N3_9BACT|nr:TolC family protein [Humisphaera borealis]QOV91020.1 TolC family protein [Humisphaera borealis]